MFPESSDDNAKYARLEAKLFGHKKSIHSLAGGLHHAHVWSCDSNGFLRIWDTAAQKLVHQMDSGQGRIFQIMRVFPNEMWTASPKSLKVWSAETFKMVRELNVFACCMERAGDNVWVGGDNKLSIYNNELSPVKEISLPQVAIVALSFDPTHNKMWTATTDKKAPIRVYDVETCESVKDIIDGHKRKVNALALSVDKIWSAGDDGAVCVWDCKTLELIRRLEGHEAAVFGVNHFGDFVWSCGWDTSIIMWDTKTLDLACRLQDFHSDSVSCIQAIWNERNQCWQGWTGSWDKSICIFAMGAMHNLPNQNSLSHPQKANQTNEDAMQIDEEKLKEINKTLEEIKEKDAELVKRKVDIQLRRQELEERKRKLSEHKQDLESRKQTISKKKQEIEEQLKGIKT